MEYSVYPGYSCYINDKGELKFSSTVCEQRYSAVLNALETSKWSVKLKKIVDFGCAKFKAFLHLKRLPQLEHMIGVDIDKDILYSGCVNIYRKSGDRTRKQVLKVEAFMGDVGVFDTSFKDVDAVIAIELIEHLHDDTLSKLPITIFEKMKPKVAIFTTPNAEFNVLFDNMESNFRHYDHKFEWTREEFEKWANDIVEKYTYYDVSFMGVGPGPEGTEYLGCCSQMAVFTLKDGIEFSDDSSSVNDTRYDFKFGVHHPVDRREEEERIKQDIEDYLYYEIDYDKDTTAVKLSSLLQKLEKDYEIDQDILLKLLEDVNCVVENNSGELYILIDVYFPGKNSDDDYLSEEEDSSSPEKECWNTGEVTSNAVSEGVDVEMECEDQGCITNNVKGLKRGSDSENSHECDGEKKMRTK